MTVKELKEKLEGLSGDMDIKIGQKIIVGDHIVYDELDIDRINIYENSKIVICTKSKFYLILKKETK